MTFCKSRSHCISTVSVRKFKPSLHMDRKIQSWTMKNICYQAVNKTCTCQAPWMHSPGFATSSMFSLYVSINPSQLPYTIDMLYCYMAIAISIKLNIIASYSIIILKYSSNYIKPGHRSDKSWKQRVLSSKQIHPYNHTLYNTILHTVSCLIWHFNHSHPSNPIYHMNLGSSHPSTTVSVKIPINL